MGKREVRIAAFKITIEKQVDIYGAATPAFFTLATEGVFNFLNQTENFLITEVRLNFYHRVQVVLLIGYPPCFCFVNRSDLFYTTNAFLNQLNGAF